MQKNSLFSYLTKTDSRTRKKIFWLFLFFSNIVAIVDLWSRGSSYYLTHPDNGNIWIAFGRLTGLFAECAILMQLVLIGRISMIEQTFGFDRMNKLHRYIGYSILIFLLGHPTLLLIGYGKANGISLVDQLGDFFTQWPDVFSAFLALMIFIYIVLLAVFARKKVRYETWYFTHLLVYVAIYLAFDHQIKNADVSAGSPLYYWLTLNFTVFGFVLFYRFIKPLWNAARFAFRVERVTMETKDTYSVYITGKDIGSFRYKAGQYANITFLQKGLWFTHPFSFSTEHNDDYVRFSMKALGDHTKRLGELRPGARVILDGPLGLFIEDVAKSDKLLFIAGGIGITPIRALLGELASGKKDFILIYAARTVDDIAFHSEFETLQSSHPFPIHYVLSTPTVGYESGFVDKEKLARLIPDLSLRDIYLCGPPPMMAAVEGCLTELGIEKNRIHFEKFFF